MPRPAWSRILSFAQRQAVCTIPQQQYANGCNHDAVLFVSLLTCWQLCSLYTKTCLSHDAHLLQQPLIYVVDEVQQNDDLE